MHGPRRPAGPVWHGGAVTVQAAARPRTGSASPLPAAPVGAGRGTVLLALASGALFLLLASVLVRTTVFVRLDRAGTLDARRWGDAHAGSPLGELVHLGDAATIVGTAVLAATMASLALRRWRPLLGTAATLVLLVALVEGSKVLLGRIPPTPSGRRSTTFFTDGTSFPSGHTAGTLVTLLLVASLIAGPGGVRPSVLAYRVLAAGAVVTGLTVGFLTTTLGWHWPTDVVGGVLLAGVAAAVGRALVHRADGQPREHRAAGPADRRPGTAGD